MRSSTKAAVGAVTFGVLTLSYNLGEQVVVANETFATPTTQAEPSSTPSATSSETTETPSSNKTDQPSATNPVASATTAPVVKQTAAPVQNSGGSANIQDGSIVQSGFGTVQVQVTKSGGKITDITMLLANATKGRAAVFPYLIQYAIDANGSNFANVSGATYTTDAFKQSLDAALAKF